MGQSPHRLWKAYEDGWKKALWKGVMDAEGCVLYDAVRENMPDEESIWAERM